MKKMFIVVAAIALAAAVIVPTTVQAEPAVVQKQFVVSTGAAITNTLQLSNSYAADPLWLNCWSVYPTNSTLRVRYIETGGDNVTRTNQWFPTFVMLNDAAGPGYCTNSLKRYSAPPVARNRALLLEFSTATQATIQAWVDLARPPGAIPGAGGMLR